MVEVELASVRLVVEHRMPGPTGGPTLRVLDEAGRERLRFDCFARGAHWHRDPSGPDEITKLPFAVDALEWTLAALREDLAGYLARAGAPGFHADPCEARAALERVESALRNPPPDLDGVDPAVRLTSRGEKWTTYPADALPLWVADMDFPMADPIRRVLQRAIDTGDIGYPIHPAPTDLPAIFSKWASDHFGWQVDESRVELLTEVVQGMHVAVHQFSEPGEAVVIQPPIYPPFRGAPRDHQRRVLENPLVWGEDGYRVDLEGLRAVVDEGTRILLLCNPHNPTGRVFSREELLGIAEVAMERDLVVVSDEIHMDLVYPGHTHIPFATLSSEVEARTITLTSASKSFNIAGLRTAVAVFGSEALKRRFNALPRHVRGGLGILGIDATRAAWLHGQLWLDAVLAYLGDNRRLLADFVAAELPGVVHHAPEATYLAWLDVSALELGPKPAGFFLERAGVALSEGTGFGAAGKGFVRINFSTSRAILSEALERIAKSLQ